MSELYGEVRALRVAIDEANGDYYRSISGNYRFVDRAEVTLIRDRAVAGPKAALKEMQVPE